MKNFSKIKSPKIGWKTVDRSFSDLSGKFLQRDQNYELFSKILVSIDKILLEYTNKIRSSSDDSSIKNQILWIKNEINEVFENTGLTHLSDDAKTIIESYKQHIENSNNDNLLIVNIQNLRDFVQTKINQCDEQSSRIRNNVLRLGKRYRSRLRGKFEQLSEKENDLKKRSDRVNAVVSSLSIIKKFQMRSFSNILKSLDTSKFIQKSVFLSVGFGIVKNIGGIFLNLLNPIGLVFNIFKTAFSVISGSIKILFNITKNLYNFIYKKIFTKFFRWFFTPPGMFVIGIIYGIFKVEIWDKFFSKSITDGIKRFKSGFNKELTDKNGKPTQYGKRLYNGLSEAFQFKGLKSLNENIIRIAEYLYREFIIYEGPLIDIRLGEKFFGIDWLNFEALKDLTLEKIVKYLLALKAFEIALKSLFLCRNIRDMLKKFGLKSLKRAHIRKLKKLKNVEGRLKKLQNEIRGLEEKRNKLFDEKDRIGERIKKLEEKLARERAKLKKAELKTNFWKNRVNDLNKNLKELNQRLKENLKNPEFSRNEELIRQQKAKIEKTEKSLNRARQKLNIWEDNVKKYSKTVGEMEEELKNLKLEETRIKGEIDSIDKKLKNKNAKAKELEAKRAKLKLETDELGRRIKETNRRLRGSEGSWWSKFKSRFTLESIFGVESARASVNALKNEIAGLLEVGAKRGAAARPKPKTRGITLDNSWNSLGTKTNPIRGKAGKLYRARVRLANGVTPVQSGLVPVEVQWTIVSKNAKSKVNWFDASNPNTPGALRNRFKKLGIDDTGRFVRENPKLGELEIIPEQNLTKVELKQLNELRERLAVKEKTFGRGKFFADIGNKTFKYGAGFVNKAFIALVALDAALLMHEYATADEKQRDEFWTKNSIRMGLIGTFILQETVSKLVEHGIIASSGASMSIAGPAAFVSMGVMIGVEEKYIKPIEKNLRFSEKFEEKERLSRNISKSLKELSGRTDFKLTDDLEKKLGEIFETAGILSILPREYIESRYEKVKKKIQKRKQQIKEIQKKSQEYEEQEKSQAEAYEKRISSSPSYSFLLPGDFPAAPSDVLYTQTKHAQNEAELAKIMASDLYLAAEKELLERILRLTSPSQKLGNKQSLDILKTIGTIRQNNSKQDKSAEDWYNLFQNNAYTIELTKRGDKEFLGWFFRLLGERFNQEGLLSLSSQRIHDMLVESARKATPGSISQFFSTRSSIEKKSKELKDTVDQVLQVLFEMGILQSKDEKSKQELIKSIGQDAKFAIMGISMSNANESLKEMESENLQLMKRIYDAYMFNNIDEKMTFEEWSRLNYDILDQFTKTGESKVLLQIRRSDTSTRNLMWIR